MFQNINVNLPDLLLAEIDRLTPQSDSPDGIMRERNSFITEAIQFYINETHKKAICESLKEGAIVRTERDLDIAREWFGWDEGT